MLIIINLYYKSLQLTRYYISQKTSDKFRLSSFSITLFIKCIKQILMKLKKTNRLVVNVLIKNCNHSFDKKLYFIKNV